MYRQPVVRPITSIKRKAGEAELPIRMSQPAPTVTSASGATPLDYAPVPGVQLALQPKRQRMNERTSTATFGATQRYDPRDGPVLLSKDHVTKLGEYVDRDVELLERYGWESFIRQRRGESDLSHRVEQLKHPAQQYLRHLRRRGARAIMSTAPWTQEHLAETMARGPHKSALEYADFLGEELVEFVLKGQWIVLPYHIVQALPRRIRKRLRVSPMGVVPQRDRRPRVIVDYSFFGVNAETVKLAPREAMQFGKALEQIL
jgi:hypothetical protein